MTVKATGRGPMQREVLHLLALTPLSAFELAGIRGWKPAHLHQWLERLVVSGFVERRGATFKGKRRGRQYQTLYRWTGKPFPPPDPTPALQLQESHALVLRSQCAYRANLSTLTEHKPNFQE